MTFAVVETGGKQYKVAEGDVLRMEKLADTKEGETVVFDKVLLVDTGDTTEVGAPYIAGKTVEAEHVTDGKGKKILVQKFKSKSRYTRRYGHRQPFTEVKVTKIA
jgi:large subunit ribosomal protein L21